MQVHAPYAPLSALLPPGRSPYVLSGVVRPDARLAAAAAAALRRALGDGRVLEARARQTPSSHLPPPPPTPRRLRSQGLNVSTDSFYAAQGRDCSGAFDDRSAGVLGAVRAAHPTAASMEMESFHLLHLAACSRGSVRAAAAAIVVANRADGEVLTPEELHTLERDGGIALVRALVACSLDDRLPAE